MNHSISTGYIQLKKFKSVSNILIYSNSTQILFTCHIFSIKMSLNKYSLHNLSSKNKKSHFHTINDIFQITSNNLLFQYELLSQNPSYS